MDPARSWDSPNLISPKLWLFACGCAAVFLGFSRLIPGSTAVLAAFLEQIAFELPG